MIRHSSSDIGPDEQQAALDVLQRNYVGHGPISAELEAAFCNHTGYGHAYAVTSGSFALLLALKALDLPPHSLVAIPVLTCPSVLNAVQQVGYRPYLVDVLPDTLCIDVAGIPNIARAVIAPHAYGAVVNIAELNARDLIWIEDCATSPASTWQGQPVGGHATLSIFSLGSTKYITGGGGGLVVTHNKTLAGRIEDLLHFDVATSRENWHHQGRHMVSGYLPDLNAAVALVQFRRMALFLKHRRQIAQIYEQGLAGLSGLIRRPLLTANPGHSYYRYIVQTANPAAEVASALGDAGIDARTSVNPWLDQFVQPMTDLPIANMWRDHLLSLPIHMGVSVKDADFIVNELREVLQAQPDKSTELDE